ncbi:MAG: Ig-like domain-containing protein [Anaerolineae bacterium]
MIDGVRQDATWSYESWDESAQEPRVFRAWVDLANGSHTVTAVATDQAGNSGQSTPVTFTVSGQNPADAVPPVLVVTSPIADTHYQGSITFSGTTSDAGSGIDVVQISLDGGWHWETAVLDGSNWNYLLENDNNMLAAINYLVAIRALDKAGNETRQPGFIVSIDNRPPSGLLPAEFEFEPGTHLDAPGTMDMSWVEAFDFSDDASGNVVTLLAVDQISDTIPIIALPDEDIDYVAPFTGNGDWYVHLAARDLLNNQIVYHFGPWHVGTNFDIPVSSRVQSIIVDGFMDFDHDEWRTDWEYLDDGEDIDNRQELYFTLDNSGVYLGWRNSWWNIDGTMWAYLDTAVGGTSQPVISTDPALPFTADYAVQVTGPVTGTVWQYSGAAWMETAVTPLDLVQGQNGDTELKLGVNVATATNLRLLAYAAADNGDIWRVFPTTNQLNGPWSDAYQWNPQTTPNFSAGQPTGTTVALQMDSPQPPDAFHGPDETLDLVFTLDNLEQRTVSGLQLDVNTTPDFSFTGVISGTCSTCNADNYVVDVPDLPPTSTLQITVTGQLAADLSAVTAVTHTVSFNSSPTQTASLRHLADGLPPEVDVNLTPGGVTFGGAITTTQTINGVANDNSGSGVALVEVRLNGGAWQPADGTTDWSAQMDAASGDITLEARATDAVGLTSLPTSTTYILDTTPPTLTLSLPITLTGQYAEFGGTAQDLVPADGQVAQIQVQIDDTDAPWLPAAAFTANGGTQTWHAAWHLPGEDWQPHQIRARAVDWAGNISTPLDWQSVNVDTVSPALNGSQLLDEVFSVNYVPVTVLSGIVTDGSGVASVEARIYDPNGLAYTQTATINETTGAWFFQPDFNNPPDGRYGLWIEATDNSGNQIHVGPYWLQVSPTPPAAYADPDGSCGGNTPCFTSLQAAIDSVSAGERVHAYGGVYDENVALNKDATVNATETMTITGDLAIEAGTFVAPTGSFTLQGDFDYSGGTFSHNNGHFICDGSGSQTIANDVTFYDLTINSGVTLITDADVTLDGQVTYEDGAAAQELGNPTHRIRPSTGGRDARRQRPLYRPLLADYAQR